MISLTKSKYFRVHFCHFYLFIVSFSVHIYPPKPNIEKRKIFLVEKIHENKLQKRLLQKKLIVSSKLINSKNGLDNLQSKSSHCVMWLGFSPDAWRCHIRAKRRSISLAQIWQLNNGLSERRIQTLALIAFKLEKIIKLSLGLLQKK